MDYNDLRAFLPRFYIFDEDFNTLQPLTGYFGAVYIGRNSHLTEPDIGLDTFWIHVGGGECFGGDYCQGTHRIPLQSIGDLLNEVLSQESRCYEGSFLTERIKKMFELTEVSKFPWQRWIWLTRQIDIPLLFGVGEILVAPALPSNILNYRVSNSNDVVLDSLRVECDGVSIVARIGAGETEFRKCHPAVIYGDPTSAGFRSAVLRLVKIIQEDFACSAFGIGLNRLTPELAERCLFQG